MQTYEIELKRTSFISIWVKAESPEKAEEAAWVELEDGDYNDKYAEWDVESIKETQI